MSPRATERKRARIPTPAKSAAETRQFMKRLGTQNLAEERPSRAVLWLFHTHPPIEQRIKAAQSFL